MTQTRKIVLAAVVLAGCISSCASSSDEPAGASAGSAGETMTTGGSAQPVAGRGGSANAGRADAGSGADAGAGDAGARDAGGAAGDDGVGGTSAGSAALAGSGGSPPSAGSGGTLAAAGTGGGTGGGSLAGSAGSSAGVGGLAGSGSIAGMGGAMAGTGGSTAGTGGIVTNSDDNVLERNHHASRDGQFTQPKLTKAVVPQMSADSAFAAQFTGNMWASPLYFANGPGGAGAFFAVTTSNDVRALSETNGDTLWTKNIGSAPQQNGLGCGNISPLGILSTPVIDAAKRVIYVAGAIGTTSTDRHEIHALDIETGSEVAGWPIDLTGTKSGTVTFNAKPQNQRAALSLINGILYVAYGGHIGDCGAFRGWVIAVNTANPLQRGAWTTLDQGSGVWAAGGLASDGHRFLQRPEITPRSVLTSQTEARPIASKSLA